MASVCLACHNRAASFFAPAGKFPRLFANAGVLTPESPQKLLLVQTEQLLHGSDRSNSNMRHSFIAIAGVLWLTTVAGVASQRLPPALLRNHPAISYERAPVADAVERLNARLRTGDVVLDSTGPGGHLRSVLHALNIPIESQVLVFSKTSFQAPRINPRNPRAIYFNDTVSVGWVRGGPVLEVAAQDARQGTIFYTLEQVTKNGPPQFERNDTCTSCHTSDATQNVPGFFVGSVFPGVDGITMYGPAYTTDHRSPFEIRWGGWFVTGRHTASRHMGNAVATDPADLGAMITPASVHVTSLEGRFDQTGYLSPGSDIVALLVLEHQAQMLNLITRAGWESRVGAADAGRPLEQAAAQLVDYLLFIDEAPLPGPIAGTTTFASTFAGAGPRDARGRSLRDLDLTRRLLKYPCSYLIYSEPFDAMPPAAKAAVYARMWEVLSGRETGDRYAVLSQADRAAILEILRETKKDLPEYFAGS